MAFTTANLLSSIERRSFMPANQNVYTTAEILAMADEALVSYLMPSIIGLREELFVISEDTTITANVASYPIPERAVGSQLREVHIVNSSGRVTDLALMQIEDIKNSTVTGNPQAFYLKGDKIVLYPTPDKSETLRLYYSCNRGSFVEVGDCAVISAINGNVVTVTSIPASWATGDVFDLADSSGSHEYKAIDKTSTLVSGTDITFSSLPSDLAVGDYIMPEKQSCLVQLPNIYREVLAQFVAADMLSAQNQPGGSDAMKKAEKLMKAAEKILRPRIVGEDEYLLPGEVWGLWI